MYAADAAAAADAASNTADADAADAAAGSSGVENERYMYVVAGATVAKSNEGSCQGRADRRNWNATRSNVFFSANNAYVFR